MAQECQCHLMGWFSLSGITVEAKPWVIIQKGEMGLLIEATTLLCISIRDQF